MKVADWLKEAENVLAVRSIGTARLDALILLEDVTGIDRARLLAESELKISAAQNHKLQKLLKIRARHMPLAYVRGKTEFYGREFKVSPAVLEPRPESEAMIDELKRLSDLPEQPSIADVGTGSGALGITAALELPKARVHLLEIDPKALKTAQMNVDLFTLEIETFKTDLLESSSYNYDVLLCNLPYVPDGFQINTAATHEPIIAIFGGPDGLDLYRRLFTQVNRLAHVPLYILCESLPPQHQALNEIAQHNQYALTTENDFITVYRRVQ